jgi:hypothetical protein
VLHLLAHQAADGSFDDSATVERIVRATPLDRGAALAGIDKLLHEAHVPSTVRPKVAHTLLVLLVLRTAFRDWRDVWQRAGKKAVRFVIDAAQLHRGQAEGWLTELEGRLGKPA